MENPRDWARLGTAACARAILAACASGPTRPARAGPDFNQGTMDSGEFARSATVTFTRSRGSKAWGEYRTVGRSDGIWEGAFVARRCK
jgi:hypothetical protein